MRLEKNKIYCIDVLNGLKKLSDNSIDCIITSPPYWNLRDYKIKCQIGNENNPNDFINKIVEILKECKRIIKPTGTIWINLGDSYFKNKGIKSNWMQTKQRLLIPSRIAIKCQDELGLILRNEIIWVKQLCNFKTKDSYGNSMPTGAKDRLNTTSESLFFFVKNKKYYFNLNNIRIPYRYRGGKDPKGKNPGSCIMFPLEPSREKHIAMFPKSLPEFCIKSGCPKNGIVLDPFMGSGTTAIVAKKLRRKFIGFDLNKNYIKIANRRLLEVKDD
ncbi:site-specific DNA-methyltransferase [Candidatus Pacearchaeota archaeon]|nr:site-specific DNA-methyltransferase [Candidatus Pacearchaeota archaeon]